MRWHRKHWLTGMGRDHPPWTDQELHDDASALTADLIETHVLTFLESVRDTSYRLAKPATVGGERIAIPERVSVAEREEAAFRMGFRGRVETKAPATTEGDDE
ncbi:MAG TPA: hypothetical protein VMW56_21860 [Candidatus Margulisiibacteriota bacterium]|nr:hypothetical protein [Candidatus Margulisiibacteriota bacterium]